MQFKCPITGFVVIASIVSLTIAAITGCGGEAGANNAAAPGATASPAGDDEPRSAPLTPREQRVARAREILADVGRTYREAPTVSDTLVMRIHGQEQVVTVRFDRDDRRIEMSIPNGSARKIGGTLYMSSDVMYDIYLEHEMDRDMASTVAQLFGWVPPYHFAMRASSDVDTYLHGLGLGILRNPRLRDHALVADPRDDEREIHRIMIESLNGVGYVFVEPETMLVRDIALEMLPPPGQPADAPPMRVLIEANPVLGEELAEPIVFDPRDREAVHDPRQMMPRPLRAGDRAPNFRLKTLDGEVVELYDLRGNVVVIDFWATWCVPCILAMPMLDRFTRWTQEERQPVRVFAINTMEEAPTAEERRRTAEEFWRERDFAMPTLLDDEGLVVARYGYNTLPMTLIIDPNGRISRIHEGFSRNMYQILKADTERALRRAAEEASGEDGE